ncbi:MAG TPA: hypothetical protein VK504_07980 [Vicinamibacterales bacterium]|nr:hypothetical protein [Vicinamibacterales bacterium]
MMRRSAIALLVFALACTTTTSVTRTGRGIFAPKEDSAAEEEEAPRGLSLSIESIASDGTAKLELRNYSLESFVFPGAPDHPRLVIEVQSGSTHSRYTVLPLRAQRHEVPPGERLQLKANLGGASGRVRIGIRSQEFGYVVWTNWIAR